MLTEFAFCVIDEVDSILIDEARTPLIISGPAEKSSEKYYQVGAQPPALLLLICARYTTTASTLTVGLAAAPCSHATQAPQHAVVHLCRFSLDRDPFHSWHPVRGFLDGL